MGSNSTISTESLGEAELIVCEGTIVGYRFLGAIRLLKKAFGKNWQEVLESQISKQGYTVSERTGDGHYSNRESDRPNQLFVMKMGDSSSLKGAFFDLYTGPFLEAMRLAYSDPRIKPFETFENSFEIMLTDADDLEINDQNRIQAIESHNDVRPTALLAVTLPEEGGELVVTNDTEATSHKFRTSKLVKHIPGAFVALLGTTYPHFVIPPTRGRRLLIAMSYDDGKTSKEEIKKLVEYNTNGSTEPTSIIRDARRTTRTQSR